MYVHVFICACVICLFLQLPASNISCGLLWVIVQCDSFETPYSLESVFDTSLPFEFNMTLDSCWNPCDISFYYNNSVGRSLDSNIITLPGPSKGRYNMYICT